MLNEILEFEAYVKSPESEKPRIQPKLLTNNYWDIVEDMYSNLSEEELEEELMDME